MAFGISVSAVKGLAHVGTWITSLLSIAGGNVFACIVAVVVVVVAILFVGWGGDSCLTHDIRYRIALIEWQSFVIDAVVRK